MQETDLVYMYQLDSTYGLPKKIQQIATPVRLSLNVATVLAQRWLEVLETYRQRLNDLDEQRNRNVSLDLVDAATIGDEGTVMLRRLLGAKAHFEQLTADFKSMGYSLAGAERVYKEMDKAEVAAQNVRLEEQRRAVRSEFNAHAQNFVTLVQDAATSQVRQTKLKLPPDLVKRIDEFACKELPAAQDSGGEAIDVEPIK